VIWYVFLVVLEALLAGWLASNFAKYKGNRYYKWLSDKFLFPYISEWHPLLTPYLLPDTKVRADILCTNNILYQGEVAQHFLREGQLSGIILSNPRRFERDKYSSAKKDEGKNEGKKVDKEDYWIIIPSRNSIFLQTRYTI
jgi:hypothetical protein